LAQRRQYARRKGSAEMNVCSPHERKWKPPLRQAARTLCDTRERQCRNGLNYDEKTDGDLEFVIKYISQNEKVTEKRLSNIKNVPFVYCWHLGW